MTDFGQKYEKNKSNSYLLSRSKKNHLYFIDFKHFDQFSL